MILHRIIVPYGLHDLAGPVGVIPRVLLRQVFRHFQHAAGCDHGRGGISRLVRAVRKLKIPVRHKILRQMGKEISRHRLESIDVFLLLRVAIAQRRAVNAPGLPARPGGSVAVALAGRSVIRLSGFHVEKEGVPGRAVLPDHIGKRRVDVLFRDIPVFLISRLLRRPVQKRQI